MNFYKLLNQLNEKQRTAVTMSNENLLVLAGAGSGKTKVLVHRIAWLILVKNVDPGAIFAVTFTNKAAEEMRVRIENLIGLQKKNMWVGTFHGLSHRILRKHYMDVELPKNFQIIDTDDQLHLVKKIIKLLNLDAKKWCPIKAVKYINNKKNQGLRPTKIKNHIENTWQTIYTIYQEKIDRAGLLDFSEILLRSYELWIKKPMILNYYQTKFIYILVDEFQDTNTLQYSWISKLAKKNSVLMIVGDDDQSIYGWRGAQVDNIQYFLKDFKRVQIIRLEQNYRSDPYILIAANTMIAKNPKRMKKNLWTMQTTGHPIELYYAKNELDEAYFVANKIKYWYQNTKSFKSCAVLYRNNIQSRVLEEVFLKLKIPYHIYGGPRFFERKEIKDVLGYLRLISNCYDDSAFERIINRPSRGIGQRTLSILRNIANLNKKTLWESAKFILIEKRLKGKAAKNLEKFINLIDVLRSETFEMKLYLQTKRIISDSGLLLMYKKIGDKKSQSRIENLEELINATKQYNNDQNKNVLKTFLSDAVLEVNDNYFYEKQDAVQMMTLHAAKGLEFLKIFIVGMEEGIFPSKMALNDSEKLEEERRLAYVGLTRTIKELTLIYAKKRRLYGQEVRNDPSRFILELPRNCIKLINFYDK